MSERSAQQGKLTDQKKCVSARRGVWFFFFVHGSAPRRGVAAWRSQWFLAARARVTPLCTSAELAGPAGASWSPARCVVRANAQRQSGPRGGGPRGRCEPRSHR